MIQSLFTQLSKQTEFIQKQNYELQREVPLNGNSTQPKNNNQSDNNIVPKVEFFIHCFTFFGHFFNI